MAEFEKLCSLVEKYTRKGGCDFYRNLYNLSPVISSLKIKKQKEWEELPFLTKEDIQKVPIEKRIFVPWGEVAFIRSTSGTSGKPPVFFPFITVPQRPASPRIQKGILTSLPTPTSILESAFEKVLGKKIVLFLLDPRFPEESVNTALAHGIDSLILVPFLLSAVAKNISGSDRMKIMYIEFHGDHAGQEVINFTKEQFPNAAIVQIYGISEIGSMTLACGEASAEHPGDTYHASADIHLEIVDPDSKEKISLLPGAEGELVCTTMYGPIAFPMIRYRTGDMARVVESTCKEHGEWSFTVIGRKDMDFIKIPKGVLRADEVERVLRSMRGKVSDEFELHYSEHATGEESPKIQVTLHVEAHSGVELSELADEIASKLRVSPSLTYAQGVERGLYLPLTCAPLQKLDMPGKRKRMVRE
ncbi:hypothetical protein A2943_00430 [Candidatus Adlerbacteria bacterium RIFCSPLOWO2_01_FULL_51_16]|uniref:AMP-dependent synthetase/ligase domain-containing protein n=1 Tax=Candidatus Adlerbacteria bacterium RIFCSPLOWO2_01_FULL_51_16 TaxID=1797243 RepID=A0A1F4XHX6_9BACT|nr:MAG: hypothetical protein A2943_00430 [Candidatus Adlerbacteria bacterium RIFCSPLOWO2_01_FULL_51_16]